VGQTGKKQGEASVPEGRSAFPGTRWSLILATGGTRDLEALARVYWRPIRAYLAARFRLDDDDADDMAQEAFAWLLETRLLDRADPERGRFRGLLKTSLGRFALERFRRRDAKKRGGGEIHEAIVPERDPADPRGRSPDEVLDDAWRRELIERARAALESELEAGGRRSTWLVFRDWFLDEDGNRDVDHAVLAARHGISRTDVSNRLDYAKRRFAAVLRALVAETTDCDDSLRAELAWLFAGARPLDQLGRRHPASSS
jgi:RNA polymerase sigma factor (sigma-70 family)